LIDTAVYTYFNNNAAYPETIGQQSGKFRRSFPASLRITGARNAFKEQSWAS